MANDPKNSDFRNDFKAAMDSIHQQSETLADIISKMSGEVSALLNEVKEQYQRINKEKVSKDGFKYVELGQETLDPKNDKSIFGEINTALKAMLDQSATNFKTINTSITKFCDSILSSVTGKKRNTENEIVKPPKTNLSDSTSKMLPAVVARGEMQRADADNKQNALTKNIKQFVDPTKPKDDKKDKKEPPIVKDAKDKLPQPAAGGTSAKKKQEEEEARSKSVASGLAKSLATSGGKALTKVLIKTGLFFASLIVTLLMVALLPHMKQIFPFLKQIGEVLIEVLGSLYKVVQTIVGAIVPLLKPLGKALVEVGKVVGSILQTLAKVLEPPLRIAARVIGKLLPIVAGLLKGVGAVVNFALKILGPVVTAIFKIIEWGVDAIIAVGKGIWSVISFAWKIISVPIKGIFAVAKGIWAVLSFAWKAITFPIKAIFSVVKGIFGVVGSIFETIGKVIAFPLKVISRGISLILLPIRKIFGFVGNISKFLSVKNIASSVWEGVKGLIGGISDAIKGVVSAPFKAIGGLFKRKDKKDDQRYAETKQAQKERFEQRFTGGGGESTPDVEPKRKKSDKSGMKLAAGVAAAVLVSKKAKEQLGQFFDQTKDRVKKLGEFFKSENLKNLKDKIETRLKDIKDHIKSLATMRINTLKENVMKRVEAAKELARKFAARARDVANYAMSILKKRAPWLAAMIERSTVRAREMAKKFAARAKDVSHYATTLAKKGAAKVSAWAKEKSDLLKHYAAKKAMRLSDIKDQAMAWAKSKAIMLKEAALKAKNFLKEKVIDNARKFMRNADLRHTITTNARKAAVAAAQFVKDKAKAAVDMAIAGGKALARIVASLSSLGPAALIAIPAGVALVGGMIAMAHRKAKISEESGGGGGSAPSIPKEEEPKKVKPSAQNTAKTAVISAAGGAAAARAKDIAEHGKALAVKAKAWAGAMAKRVASRAKELAGKLASRAKDIAGHAKALALKGKAWAGAMAKRVAARAKEFAGKLLSRKNDLASHSKTLASKHAASLSLFAKERALRLREKAEVAKLYLSKKLQRMRDLKDEALAFAKKKALILKESAMKAGAFVKEKVIDKARQFMRNADLRHTIATTAKKNALAAAQFVKDKARAALDIAISGGKAIAKMVASMAGLGPLALIAIPAGIALIGTMIALAHRKAKTSGDSGGGGAASASIPNAEEQEKKQAQQKPKTESVKDTIKNKVNKAKELSGDLKAFRQKAAIFKAMRLMRARDFAQQKAISLQSIALKRAELANERATAMQKILTKGGESIMNTVQAFSSLGLLGIPLIPVGVAGIIALIALAMKTAKLGGGAGGGGAKMPKPPKDKQKPDDLKPPTGPDASDLIEQQKLKELRKIRKLLEQQVASQNGTQANTKDNADTAKEILAILPSLAGGGGSYVPEGPTVHDVTGNELSAYRKHYLHIDTNISRKTIPA